MCLLENVPYDYTHRTYPQMDMNYFLKEMKSKVSSAMQGADQKAVESEAYKEVVKHIIVSDLA